MEQQSQDQSGVESGDHIVQDDAITILDLAIKVARRLRFEDIKKTKEEETENCRLPGKGEKGDRHQIADEFVDDDAAVIDDAVNLSGFARDPTGQEEESNDRQNPEERWQLGEEPKSRDSGQGAKGARCKGRVAEPGITR